MVLKEIDFLSPPISLYYKGSSSPASSCSGVLTILTFVITILFSFCYIQNLFNRSKEIPISTSYTLFTSDAGIIPLNSSSLFHFISIEDINNKGNEDFDFHYFNVIGLEGGISAYKNDNNITNYNHWLYGLCDSKLDIKDIKDVVNHSYFSKSACLRKYYDKETQKYYNINEPEFKWPSIEHGTFNINNKYYSIIIAPCQKNISNILFEGEITCESEDNFDISSKTIHLNFIDHYIDIMKYKNPIIKYAYRIENKLDKDNYSVNHLNFNPSLVKSSVGYVWDIIKEYNSYSYERNEPFTYSANSNIY